MFRRVSLLVLPVVLAWSRMAVADQFHYSNLVIGDRAVGLGGAFGAVSDDASGVFYNPGGLGFALTNDVSGTANAFLNRTITYKKALGSMDFKEESSANPPVFFGILQKLDHISKGLVVAFALTNTDAELKDQDDLIENVDITSHYVGGAESASHIHRYHRTVNARGSSSQAALAVAKRLGSSVSVGLGFSYNQVSELVQEYQDTIAQGYVTGDDGQTGLSATVGHQTQNIRQNLTAAGIQSILGIQAALGGKFSVGLTAKAGKWASSELDFSFEQLQTGIPQDGSKAITDAIAAGQAVKVTTNASLQQRQLKSKKEEALGDMPAEGRLGLGWFASTRALITADVTWVDAVDDAQDQYKRDAVLNYATGIEYYLMPAIPIRAGVFTNNDARPKLDHAKQGQRDHIDFFGETLFVAWVQPNSQLAAGLVLQQGTGEAQKTGDMSVQEVDASLSTFAFSISQSL